MARMLIFVVLIKSLIYAIIAFGLGAAVSLLAWLLGLVLRINIPAILRWGLAGLAIAILAFGPMSHLLREPDVTDPGWRNTAEVINQVCIGLACVGLFVTGFLISVTKIAVKSTYKGVKAINKALDEDNPQQPPPLP